MKKINAIKIEEYIEDEDEIIDTFNDDFEMEEPQKIKDSDAFTYKEDNDYEDADVAFNKIHNVGFIKIFNIIFILLTIVMVLITVDIVCVAKYNKGPFFAIKTKTYNDGGSKEYYGIGYKVIKYNVTEGKKSTQIGLWSMPYSIEATPIEDIDFAIEFINDPEKTASKYYNQYLNIESSIKKVDKKNNKVLLEYTDPDGKYTLQIDCKMGSDKNELTNYTEKKKINVKGTVYKFYIKDNKKTNTVYMSNCFIEK